MPETFYHVAWIFIIYSFIGWCTEVAYAALDTGKFTNRGFLNGPICPIYGFGVLTVLVCLIPIKENFLLLFIGSMFLTTVIEFIAGFLLEKLFNTRWWDYSTDHFNICGYVCLKFSILWGMACVLIVDVIHPIIFKIINVVPQVVGIILLIILILYILTDCFITVASILKFNKRLKGMEEIAGQLKKLSNELGENIYEGVIEAMEKGDVLKTSVDNKKQEIMELKEKYKLLMEKNPLNHNRLIKAFPNLKSKMYNEQLSKIRKYLDDLKK